MYVRWQSRKRRTPMSGRYGKRRRDGITLRSTNRQDQHWAVILVENARVNGKPTQRHVAYLGGITDSAIEIRAQRRFFWDAVIAKVDQLANRISREQRRAIEAAIAKKVSGPPSKEERAQLDRDRGPDRSVRPASATTSRKVAAVHDLERVASRC